jgi:hypothetical protein
MSDEKIEEAFWQTAERMLEIANEHGKETDPGVVSEAMLYAAARFATFVMAVNSESQADFVADRSDAFKFLSGRFRDMLDENFDDYGEKYQDYLPDKTST